MRLPLIGLLSGVGALLGAWLATPGDAAVPLPTPGEIIEVPTIAAPVFRDGRVGGYFLVRVTLEIGERDAALAAVPARTVLADAVIGYVFANPALRFEDGAAFDHDAFRDGLLAAVADRIGDVRALYVTQVDFLSKEEIRQNALGRRSGPPA